MKTQLAGRIVLAAIVLFLLSQPAARNADGQQSDADKAADHSAAADIPALIRDLDANRFSQRQTASQKLRAAGQRAITALAEAALGESREAATRSFEILKEHFTQGDGALKEAATAALEKLAAADKPSIARKAQDVLNPKPPQPERPNVQLFPAQMQFRVQIGGAQQIQVQNVNGVNDIQVKENDRQIKIHEDPKEGITVEVTQKKDGKDVTEKSSAKDAAELKKKHPEAHKLYEKYKQRGGVQMIQGLALPGPMQQIGGIVNPQPVPAGNISRQEIARNLEKITEQLDTTRKLLGELKTKTQDVQSLEKAIEQLEKAKKDLEETRSKVQ